MGININKLSCKGHLNKKTCHKITKVMVLDKQNRNASISEHHVSTVQAKAFIKNFLAKFHASTQISKSRLLVI